jgi:CRISPR-associated protein Cst1
MVLTALSGKEHVSSLSLTDIRHLFGDGRQLARDNQTLKCFTMVFGTNGPLTQPAYKKTKKNEAIYLSILRRLLDCAEQEGQSGQRCDLTGIRTNLDFHSICAHALTEAGLPVPERKWLGRDWIPLGGSLGNDAQALPVASRPLHVSALALFALQYLPLGVFLFKGRLTCYQSTAVELTQALTAEVVVENRKRIGLGDTEIFGKGSGTGVLLDMLMKHFEAVRDVIRERALPPNTSLLLWLFSNSGASADCRTEPVPESALRFVYEAQSAGFGSEVQRLLKNDPKDPRFQLFECIRTERDYPALYPYKKLAGASAEFYDFYQCGIRGTSAESLAVARKLAGFVVSGEPKRLKEVRKAEFLRSGAGRNLIRKYIIGALDPGEYDVLFPSKPHPVRVESAGWEFLRYYLSRQESDTRPISLTTTDMKTTHPKIIQIAETYRGQDPKKVKSLLDRMSRREIGVRWLQDKFCKLAEQHKDWNLGAWDELVCDEDGKLIAFELLFQIRLYLSNLYREEMANNKGEAA